MVSVIVSINTIRVLFSLFIPFHHSVSLAALDEALYQTLNFFFIWAFQLVQNLPDICFKEDFTNRAISRGKRSDLTSVPLSTMYFAPVPGRIVSHLAPHADVLRGRTLRTSAWEAISHLASFKY